jgi:hypothetical protein
MRPARSRPRPLRPARPEGRPSNADNSLGWKRLDPLEGLPDEHFRPCGSARGRLDTTRGQVICNALQCGRAAVACLGNVRRDRPISFGKIRASAGERLCGGAWRSRSKVRVVKGLAVGPLGRGCSLSVLQGRDPIDPDRRSRRGSSGRKARSSAVSARSCNGRSAMAGSRRLSEDWDRDRCS